MPDPPPIRSKRGRSILFIAASAMLALVLLIVVMNIDRKPDHPAATQPLDPSIELVPPSQLSEEEMRDSSTDPDQFNAIRADQGMKLEFMDPDTGKLAQWCRASHLEPNPDGRVGWLRLTDPLIVAYMSDHKVVTLQGRSALIHAPKRVLQEGTLTEAVIVRVYEGSESRSADINADVPTLEVRTEAASFDNFQGEVRCPDHVDIQTAELHLPGSGLRLLINDKDKRPEWLSIDHVEQIRLVAKQESVKQENTAPSTPPAAGKTGDGTAAASGPAEDHPETRPDRKAGLDRPAESRSTRPVKDRNDATTTKPATKATTRPSRPAAPEAPAFYVLTLKDQVNAQLGSPGTGWTASGDELNIVFSMKSRNLLAQRDASDQAPAMSFLHARSAKSEAAPEPTDPGVSPPILVALALGAGQSAERGGLYQGEGSAEEVVVTCNGPLTMAPLVNGANRPDSPSDARLELTGRPVALHNSAESIDIACISLLYQTESQCLTLDGELQTPLTIDSPELHAVAQRLWIDRLKNLGAFVGAGFMTTGRAIASAPMTKPAAPAPATKPGDDVRIAWTQGVDLALAPGRQGDAPSKGRLRQAVFRGDVDVTSSDVLLAADSLDIGFPADEPDSRRSINSLIAKRNVHARSASDQGSIDCGELSMKLGLDASGKTVPLSLTADQDIAATDKDHQSVFADHLEIAFLPPDAAPRSDEGATRSDRAAAKVSTMVATGDVQVLLADGSRAFAQRLDADASRDTAALTDPSLVVVSDRSMVRGGRRLELRKSDRKAIWPGAGEFIYFTTPVVDASARTRIARPTVDEQKNPRQMQASWSGSMAYDSLVNDGAGSITLDGDVRARSTPGPLEVDTISSNALAIDFAARPGAATRPAASEPASTSPATGLNLLAGGGRDVRQFLATGQAKLESRTWMKADHSDTPRVFYLSGPSVRYNDQTLESLVDGEGELLVRDETVVAAASAPATQPGRSSPFSTRGTSLFRWKKKLEMTRQPDGRYLITMLEGVEVRHMAPDKTLSTLTGDMLQATVARSAGKPAAGTPARDAAFDLGGTMDLQRLRGSGGIYIDAPTRDIQCDEFDYDYKAGSASLASRSPRTVIVTTKGSPLPIRAGSVIWNITEDKITANNVSGAAPR